MYHFFVKYKICFLLGLLMAAGMVFTVNSCNKDKQEKDEKIECHSFIPLKGGKNSPVILYGKGFGIDLDHLVVKFNDHVAQVTRCDGDEVVVLTPEEPGVSCTISVSNGKTSAQFTEKFNYVRSAQACDSFEPLEGFTGTPVTLIGNRFGGDPTAVEVKFNGKTAVITKCEDTEIGVITPDDIGDLCDITVTLNGITVQFTQKFTYHAFTLDSFSPEEGGPGTEVSLTGSRFGANPEMIQVMFDNKLAEIKECTDTKIVVITPTKLPKACTVSVKKGISSFKPYQETFTYLAEFELESFKPATGGTGTRVTLFGDGFGTNPVDVEIKFNETVATVLECFADSLWVVTPDQLDAECTISVKMGITTDNFEENYSYISALTLKSFYPLTGSAATRVTLRGYNFGDNPANIEIKFNETVATASACFHDSIHVFPPRAPGAECTIQVSKTTSESFTPKFAYLPSYWVSTIAGTQGQQGFQEGTLLTARFDPKHIVCDADDNLIIVAQDGGNYSAFIDIKNNEVKKLVSENYGQALNTPCITPDGLTVFITPNNTGWGNGCLNETEINNLETGIDYFYKLEYAPGAGWTGTNAQVNLLRPTEQEIEAGKVNFWLRAFHHSYAYSTYDNMIYYRSNSSGGVTKFDPVTNKGEWALNEFGEKMFMVGHTGQDCVVNTAPNQRADGYLAFDPTEPHMLYGALAGRNSIAFLNIKTGETGIYAGVDLVQSGGTGGGFAEGTLATARFNNPGQIAIDNNGNIIVADRGNHRIRKIDRVTGMVSTVAGGASSVAVDGIGTAARFNTPSGVAIGKDGAIYVADRSNRLIRKIVLE